MTSYHYLPHRHAVDRQATGPVTTAATARSMHGPGPVARFNAGIGLFITQGVGTMWCAYAFAVLALVSAPAALSSGNALVIVAWVAQTFLQLVLLPVIMVGQNVQAASADRRSKATYDDATMILSEVRQIQAHLVAQDADRQRLRERLLAAEGPTPFDTLALPAEPTVVAPDGSDVRVLLQLAGGSMAHFELAAGRVSVAVRHRTVEEIWYVVAGTGRMWRSSPDGRADVVVLAAGVCLTIPVGTTFQFRADSDGPLSAVAVTMPPWPGDGEAEIVTGPWPPSAP
jgi:mannose-6-phosphate isomerase-like protein (cupin superfamily)